MRSIYEPMDRVSKTSQYFMEKLIEEAIASGLDFYLVIAPLHKGVFDYYFKDKRQVYQDYVDYLRSLEKKYPITLLDLSQDKLREQGIDFSDTYWHDGCTLAMRPRS